VGVNLKIPLFLSQAAAKELEKNHGSIINISDANYENPKEGYSVYSLAKAGLVSLTKSLAQEMAPKVRVNSVLLHAPYVTGQVLTVDGGRSV